MPRQSQGHGGVSVVAAGVHGSGVAGGVGQAGGLLDGQGVHVRPEGHGLWFSGVQKGADARGDGGKGLQLEAGQGGADIGAGFRQTVVQLRDTVQGTAVFNHRQHNIASLSFIQLLTI